MLLFQLNILFKRVILLEEEFQQLETLLHFMDPMLYLLTRKKLLCRRSVLVKRKENLMANDVKGKSSKRKILDLYGVTLIEEAELKDSAENIGGKLQEIKDV
jgi:hypothetical protein